MLEVKDKFMLSQIKIKNSLIILGCFFISSLNSIKLFAQDTYLKLSEKDCINCKQILINGIIKNIDSDFQILLPENYRGKRFNNLNSLYFNNSINENYVIFSDSLMNVADKSLHGLSGLVVFVKGDVMFNWPLFEKSLL